MNIRITSISLFAAVVVAVTALAAQAGEKPIPCDIWQPVGAMCCVGSFKAFVVQDGALIAGNDYGVFRWDGGSWANIGVVTGGGPFFGYYGVKALAVYNGDLIAGGHFDTIAGVSANRIARWDGTTWSPLGSGIEGTSYSSVQALSVYNGDLIAAGLFDTAGGVSAASVARWDGTTWAPLGQGLGTILPVNALAVYNGELIAGGNYTLARWNGVTWEQLWSESDISGIVYAMTPYDGDLVIGGWFCNWVPYGGCISTGAVWAWDGAAWSAVGGEGWSWRWHDCVTEGDGGCLGVVRALTSYNGDLIAAGWFALHGYGSVVVPALARWTGLTWEPVGSELAVGSYVDAVTTFDDRLVAAGFIIPVPFVPGVPGGGYPTASWQGCASADLDRDGYVNGSDLASLLSVWTGAASYAPCPPIAVADLNGDCKINGFDLALLLGAWGP